MQSRAISVVQYLMSKGVSPKRLVTAGFGEFQPIDPGKTDASIKAVRDIGKKGVGGVKYTDKDTKDFEEIIDELQKLTSLVMKFNACVVSIVFHPDGSVGKPVANFHYDAKGQLVDAPPPART
jgi:hypothetical protein